MPLDEWIIVRVHILGRVKKNSTVASVFNINVATLNGNPSLPLSVANFGARDGAWWILYRV